MNYQIYTQRRRRLAEQMQAGVAVIPTAPERPRNRDSTYPYRFDSYFHYLTGFGEPEAVLVLVAGAAPKSILFCREKNAEREVWDGFRHGPEAAREAFGFDEAYPIAMLDEMMTKLLADQPSLHFHLGADSAWDARAVGWLNAVRAEVRNGIAAPSAIRDVRVLLDEMRLIKSAEEIATMRRAAEISAAAHRRAMQQVRPGRHEYEIEAELLHEFRRHGAQAPAYSSIVAGGANACVLHYVDNSAGLRDGDLLLIDAGCELDGYAADITRTFPVNGRYSAAQKDVYEMVLAAQAAAIGCRQSRRQLGRSAPGRPQGAGAGHDRPWPVHGKRGRGAGIGRLQALLHAQDRPLAGDGCARRGRLQAWREWRKLEAGMVLTVEPGCYIRPGEGVPEHLWNIGIRIEDDVLVTAQGCEVLTLAAPKTVAEIEAVMEAEA